MCYDGLKISIGPLREPGSKVDNEFKHWRDLLLIEFLEASINLLENLSFTERSINITVVYNTLNVRIFFF